MKGHDGEDNLVADQFVDVEDAVDDRLRKQQAVFGAEKGVSAHARVGLEEVPEIDK